MRSVWLTGPCNNSIGRNCYKDPLTRSVGGFGRPPESVFQHSGPVVVSVISVLGWSQMLNLRSRVCMT